MNRADTIVVPAASIAASVSIVASGSLTGSSGRSAGSTTSKPGGSLPRPQPLRGGVERDAERAPPVGERDRTPQRALGPAADPDRHVWL